ncbi:MAG: flavin reductase [Gammaproteobacteria bacterium]|jgi:flavin reductase (DIM6/NTAB) family NADH-FMN oxidoreductase RutF|nr:flavin reductase [Gammaproteobacteria bacterium]
MSVTETAYRDAISRFLSGVTVITTSHGGEMQGITATAVASVTLQPPTLLVCLNRQSATCRTLIDSGLFAVNILQATQQELAQRFATKQPDKFAGVATMTGHSGVPLLSGALANLECRVSAQNDVGTHRIFFGEVLSVAVAEGVPLGYFRGKFSALAL